MRRFLFIITISLSILTAHMVDAFDFYGASVSDKEAPSSYIKYGINGYHPIINEVALDSPASEAGLKKGDIVLFVNNKIIRKTNELRSVASDVINFTVFNGFERKTVSIDRSPIEREKARRNDSVRKHSHDSQIYPQVAEHPDNSPPLKFDNASLEKKYGNSSYSPVRNNNYRTTKSTRSVDAIGSAFNERRSGVQVAGEGVVSKLLSDDNDGSRHQRFILTLPSGQKLLMAHNIDLAPRIASLKEGDSVAFYGVYEWNAKGGVIHWTHLDPDGRHEAGWLKHAGRTYQ
jgi:membrane-associated protease RseP (regulator of RpoE activity)